MGPCLPFSFYVLQKMTDDETLKIIEKLFNTKKNLPNFRQAILR